MAESIEHYIADLEAFAESQLVVNNLRSEVSAVVPGVRRKIKERALSTLPKGGGLNKWVASITIRTKQQVYGRSVHVTLIGGRNSKGGRSDVTRIDAGAVRHPAWGRRGFGQWSLTAVEPGFFTKPATEEEQWRSAADRALDKALEGLR